MDYCDVINLPSHRTAEVTVNKITEVIHVRSGPSKKCQKCFKSLTMLHNGGESSVLLFVYGQIQGQIYNETLADLGPQQDLLTADRDCNQ